MGWRRRSKINLCLPGEEGESEEEEKLKNEMEGGKTRADTLTLNSPRWKKIFAPPPLHSSCSSSGFAATRTCQTQ